MSLAKTTILSIVILIAEIVNVSGVAATESRFIDVPEGSYAYEEISEVTGRGFMIGTDSEVFDPESILTRAQIVQILYRLDGEPEYDPEVFTLAGFRDVSRSAWYFPALAWAYEHGISLGSEYLMRPDAPMTREELAAVLYRHSEEEYAVLGRVSVPAEVSAWATVAFEWAAASDIMAPSDPQGFVTRADMAVILCDYVRFLNHRETVLSGF